MGPRRRLTLRASPICPPELVARLRQDAARGHGPVAPEDLVATIQARLAAGDPAWRLILAEDRRGRLGGYAVWQRLGATVHIVLLGHWSGDRTAPARLVASGLPWGAAGGAVRGTAHARHRPRAWARLTGWTHTGDLYLVEA